MKHSLLKVTLLGIVALTLSNFTTASNVIVEFDGSSKPFVISDWTVDSPGFAITSSVNITTGKTGTLAIANTNLYKNLTIKILYEKANQAPSNSIMANITLTDNSGATLVENNKISDNTSATENSLTVNFANATGFEIQKFMLSNPNKNAKIIYLKISGDLVGGSSSGIAEQQKAAFNVKVNLNHLTVTSQISGSLSIYNAAGQNVGSYTIQKGENIISNATSGLSFLIFTDQDHQIIEKKKIMR